MCIFVFKVQEGVQSSVQRGRKTIASLAVVQIACLVAEAVLSSVERVCRGLMVNGTYVFWEVHGRDTLP